MSDNPSSDNQNGLCQSISRKRFSRFSITKEQLEYDLFALGLGRNQIATKYGCHSATIAKRIAECNIVVPEYLKHMRSRKARMLKVQGIVLSDRQKEVIVGSVLGDGRLCKTGTTRNTNFQITHCAKQKEYILWKHKELEPFSLSIRKMVKYDSFYFSTICFSELNALQSIFYDNRKKVVPDNIGEYLSVLGLAVWFMDDGYTGDTWSLIATCSFTEEECIILLKVLQNKFGVSGYVRWQHSSATQRTYQNLYFPKVSHVKLHNIIDPLFLSCFNYKRLESGSSETKRRTPLLKG